MLHRLKNKIIDYLTCIISLMSIIDTLRYVRLKIHTFTPQSKRTQMENVGEVRGLLIKETIRNIRIYESKSLRGCMQIWFSPRSYGFDLRQIHVLPKDSHIQTGRRLCR